MDARIKHQNALGPALSLNLEECQHTKDLLVIHTMPPWQSTAARPPNFSTSSLDYESSEDRSYFHQGFSRTATMMVLGPRRFVGLESPVKVLSTACQVSKESQKSGNWSMESLLHATSTEGFQVLISDKF